MKLHHVAAVGRSLERSKVFYTQLLGLSLLSEGPSFDDPATTLTIFADAGGRQLHLLFYPRCVRGSNGLGGISSLIFSVPAHALLDWASRLGRFLTKKNAPEMGFSFRDPDGLSLCLVGGNRPGINMLGVGLEALEMEAEQQFWQTVAGTLDPLDFLDMRASGPLIEHRLGFGVFHHLAVQGSPISKPTGRFQREGYRSSYLYSPAGLLCELVTE